MEISVVEAVSIQYVGLHCHRAKCYMSIFGHHAPTTWMTCAKSLLDFGKVFFFCYFQTAQHLFLQINLH